MRPFAVLVLAMVGTGVGCASGGEHAGHDHSAHDHHHDHAAEEVIFRPDMDVVVIAEKGEAVQIDEHLVHGKVTVIDFGAEWCAPCKDVDALLFQLLDAHSDLAVRKIDVVDWESDAAKMHLKNVAQLPYVQIYDKQGKRVDAVSGLDLERLKAAIKKGQES
jgi:thiol-disulfide isomerase/thioredoxin